MCIQVHAYFLKMKSVSTITPKTYIQFLFKCPGTCSIEVGNLAAWLAFFLVWYLLETAVTL